MSGRRRLYMDPSVRLARRDLLLSIYGGRHETAERVKFGDITLLGDG